MQPSRNQPAPSGGRRAQSTVIGFALVIAIVVAGTTAVVVLGADALSQTRGETELQRAEHSMTLFDSRAAMVALGTSDTQSLAFGRDGGSFETRPDDGYVAIKHVNYTEGETETLYNRSLGSVVYENGETDMVYQGGGVWRLDSRGTARLVSPPEFHYRRSTLTLPIIRVLGRSSGSGAVRATVDAQEQARLVYPNRTADLGAPNATGAPYNYSGQGRPYANPLENGTVHVFVHSRYYQGWAEYFRQRTTGEVKVYDGNNTVRLTLLSIGGSLGRFPIPDEGNGQAVSGIGTGHPIKNFNLSLDEGAQFNGASHWSLYAIDDDKELEIHFELKSGGGCRDARVAFYYEDSSARQEWQTDYLDPGAGTDDAYVCDDSGGDVEMQFNLTSRNVDIDYEDIDASGTASGKYCFDVNDDAPDSTAVLDQHSGYDPGSIGAGSYDDDLNFTTNHYLSLLGPDYELKVMDGQGSSPPACDSPTTGSGGKDLVDEDPSVGVLEFAEVTGAQYITYLHVTENEIEVEFE